MTIDDTGSATLAGSDTLTGALQIDAGATATVSGTLSAGASVNFNGASATLSLGVPASFTDTIGGVGFDDIIFLKEITATAATLNGSNQVVVKNGTTTNDTLQLSGSNSGFAFVTQAVTGGTNIVALPKTATVAQYLLVPTLFDKISAGFAISDTAAHITTSLNSLGDAKINSITVSDNAAVGASVAQLTSDATAIGKLKNANATPYQLAISDTAATVLAGLATLETNVAHIASITATGGPVSVNVSTFSADQAALDKIVGGFAISDMAANISSGLDYAPRRQHSVDHDLRQRQCGRVGDATGQRRDGDRQTRQRQRRALSARDQRHGGPCPGRAGDAGNGRRAYRLDCSDGGPRERQYIDVLGRSGRARQDQRRLRHLGRCGQHFLGAQRARRRQYSIDHHHRQCAGRRIDRPIQPATLRRSASSRTRMRHPSLSR